MLFITEWFCTFWIWPVLTRALSFTDVCKDSLGCLPSTSVFPPVLHLTRMMNTLPAGNFPHQAATGSILLSPGSWPLPRWLYWTSPKKTGWLSLSCGPHLAHSGLLVSKNSGSSGHPPCNHLLLAHPSVARQPSPPFRCLGGIRSSSLICYGLWYARVSLLSIATEIGEALIFWVSHRNISFLNLKFTRVPKTLHLAGTST